MNTISLTRAAALVRQGQAGPWNHKPTRPVARLECINSRADMYGNRYWAFVWTDCRGTSVSATIRGGESNISDVIREMGLDCKQCLYTREEMPIREFNRLTRDWPYAGCPPKDIANFIKSQINNPLMDQRIAQAGPWSDPASKPKGKIELLGNICSCDGFGCRDHEGQDCCGKPATVELRDLANQSFEFMCLTCTLSVEKTGIFQIIGSDAWKGDKHRAQAGPWNAGRAEEELNKLRSRVKTHGGYPAVNVKVYNGVSYRDVMDHFQCSKQEAERVAQIYWDAACEDFWMYWGDEGAQNPAQQHFGGGVKIYSEGRSNGWLVVDGLPEIEAWDSDMLEKWDKFETDVEADVKWRMSKEQAIEVIESNQWIEQGA